MAHNSPAIDKANQPVDARQATESAFRCFETLFSKKLPRVSDPSLEEIEMSKEGRYWLVTLGFNETPPINPYLPKFLQVPLRKLKVFKVDAATGRVLSMKIPQNE
jgi:hypothetical protein